LHGNQSPEKGADGAKAAYHRDSIKYSQWPLPASRARRPKQLDEIIAKRF